jgi:hypothetical protein
MHGTVISVPILPSTCQLPCTDADAPPYAIQLIDGSTHQVSPLLMDDIVAPYHYTSSSSSTIHFPSWLHNSQNVMYLKDDGDYIKW